MSNVICLTLMNYCFQNSQSVHCPSNSKATGVNQFLLWVTEWCVSLWFSGGCRYTQALLWSLFGSLALSRAGSTLRIWLPDVAVEAVKQMCTGRKKAEWSGQIDNDTNRLRPADYRTTIQGVLLLQGSELLSVGVAVVERCSKLSVRQHC